MHGASRPGTSALAETRTRELLSHASVQSKQKAAIEKIRKDNEDLKEELLLENKLSVRPTKHTATMRIARLQDEADVFTRKIELEKRRIGFLELKIGELKDKIRTVRQSMGGMNAARDADRTLEKQIKILENRLEKAYRTYSEGATKNRQLREMIDSFRRERLMLENINLGLEKENDKLKKQMTKIVKNTKSVHETREAAMEETAALKTRIDKLQCTCEKEWADLTAIIDNEKRAQELKRLREMEERERKTQELLHSSQETDSRRRSGAANSTPIDKQVQARNEAMEKAQRYTMAFEQIHEATGIEDMDDVVRQIAEAEDTNYTLFNFVRELSRDIEKLQARIEELKDDFEPNAPPQTSSTEESSARLSPGPPVPASQPEKENIRETKRTTEELLRGATELIQLLPNAYKSAAGCSEEEVTVENVEHYLGKLESFAADLLTASADASTLRRITGVPSLPSQFSVTAPSTHLEDVESLEAELFDDEKPAFGETLRSNVVKTLERKTLTCTLDSKTTRRRF